MSNKGGNILEKHIDKIILAVIALVCLYLLGRTFIFTPYKVEIRGDNLGPGSIDREVLENAQALERKVEVPPKKDKPDYPELAKTQKFKAFLDNSLRDPNEMTVVVDESLSIPLPAPASDAAALKRVYQMPQLVELEDPEINLYRGVAEVPLEKVDLEHPYESVSKKLDDVDLVSVQAEFNISELYDNFYEAFAGRNVKNKWRDQTLAVPVFVRAELQRKVVNPDGSEGDWQVVPFPKVNAYSELLDLPESVIEYNTTGLRTVYARLSTPETKREILQPSVYNFAYPNYQWIAPEFDITRQEMIEKQKQRERMAAAPERRTEQQDQRRRSRDRRDGGGGGGIDMGMPGGGGGGAPGMMPGGGGGGRRSTRRREPRRQEPQQRTRPGMQEAAQQEDPEQEFTEVVIGEETDLSDVEEMVIWAHDDTAQPGKAYKYRMRLGVANPIAGVAGASWQQEPENPDALIFWTNFVEPEETIKIPKRMYIFATDVKREVDKTVAIEVAKYNLGNWYKHEFILRPGDLIGDEIEVEIGGENQRTDIEPEMKMVDFSTDSVLVDVVQNNKWMGGGYLSPRSYFEVLYTNGEDELVNTPANSRFWASEAKTMYNEIEQAVKEHIDVTSGTGSKGFSPDRGTTPGEPGMMPGMMPGMPGMPGMDF